MTMRKMTITENSTIVELEWYNSSYKNMRGHVHRPGEEETFYILDKNTGEKYNLIDKEGIHWAPDWTELPSYSTLTFQLIFERVNPEIRDFDMIEGNLDTTNENPWHFYDVKINNN